MKAQFDSQLNLYKKKEKKKKQINKKHSENADTSTSATFDLDM